MVKIAREDVITKVYRGDSVVLKDLEERGGIIYSAYVLHVPSGGNYKEF